MTLEFSRIAMVKNNSKTQKSLHNYLILPSSSLRLSNLKTNHGITQKE